MRFSSLYGSAPREYEEQDWFLNAVGTVETEDSPKEVSQELRGIEAALKKAPPFKFGPRTIDLDLLLYGEEVVEENGLTVPHPRMHERRFVLEPLCELIDPEKTHPTLGKSWEELLAATEEQECTPWEETS
jgi:2-amino-4-hydroxy-6-hydroxymethyldihydropteridine diphosphokinase